MPEAQPQSLTREDALQYLRRFPEQGRLAVAINLGLVLAGNALVFWLLWSGQLRAAHLIVLVLLETLLLLALGWLQLRIVPQRDWSEPPKPARERVGPLVFLAVWIGGAYGLTLVMVHGYGDLRALATSPQAWIDAKLHWPLLYTAGLALLHFFSDLAYYRTHGGKFLAVLSHDTMARVLTLILGGIPFAMPFFAAVGLGVKGIEFVAKKAKVAPAQSALASAAMLGVAGGSFALVSWLMSSGTAGWAIGFVFAKLIAEAMVALVPLVMGHVARNGP
jgi:hypothetical protein